MPIFPMRGAISAAAFCLPFIAVPAFAHVTLAQRDAPSGSLYKAVVKVPHGCGDAATTAIKVAIPEGVLGVKPQPKPGWTLATETGPYAKSYAMPHAGEVREGVTSVTWSGGELPDAHYDEFTFVAYIAPEAAPKTLYFPTIQTCGTLSAAWTEVPSPAAPKPARPAPALRVAAAGQTPPSATAETKVGDLVIAQPWSRATPAGAKVAGGYVKITNTGTVADRLTGGSFDAAGRFEIHEMAMNNGVMTMRPVKEGLEIPPGGDVVLAPGGYHLMFQDLKRPLAEGDSVKGTLIFEKAGTVDVTFTVRGIGAGAPAGAAPTGGMHHQH